MKKFLFRKKRKKKEGNQENSNRIRFLMEKFLFRKRKKEKEGKKI